MSASWPGSMKGPWAKTPLLLLLLLLLLSTLTRTVLCQDDGEEENAEEGAAEEEENPSEPIETPTPDIDATLPSDQPATEEGNSGEPNLDGSGSDDETNTDLPGTTADPEQDLEALNPIIILIPVVLVVLIIAMIVCGIVINRRWNKKARDKGMRKEDPYLDGSSSEKVPMPMFEEDVPSVLELEMDELDQWMKKDGETAEESKHK